MEFYSIYPFASSSTDSVSWAWFCLAVPCHVPWKETPPSTEFAHLHSLCYSYLLLCNKTPQNPILNGNKHLLFLWVSQMARLDGNSSSMLHMASVDWWYSLPRWLTNIAGQLMLASGWELAQGSQSGTLVPLHTAAQASSQRGGWIPRTILFFFFPLRYRK